MNVKENPLLRVIVLHVRDKKITPIGVLTKKILKYYLYPFRVRSQRRQLQLFRNGKAVQLVVNIASRCKWLNFSNHWK